MIISYFIKLLLTYYNYHAHCNNDGDTNKMIAIAAKWGGVLPSLAAPLAEKIRMIIWK